MTDYLQHYGAKGMKWGIRRFQNEDGSLTDEGKARYNRGKELSKEHRRIRDEKRWEILSKDKKYDEAVRDRDKADEDYARATDDWDREQASYDRGRADAVISQRQDRADAKALKHANEVITKKYGNDSLSDIEHYEKESAEKFNKFVGGALALATVAAIGATLLSNRRNNR